MDLGEFLVDLSGLESELASLKNDINELRAGLGTAIPTGTIIAFNGFNSPQGYLACDGSRFSEMRYPLLYELLGTNVLPDYRGLFLRGHDSQGLYDPDGKQRKIGEIQGDAIRNITGKFTAYEFTGYHHRDIYSEGALYTTGEAMFGGNKNSNDKSAMLAFDASRVVPTADENRPINACVLYCIKHD